MPRLTGKVEAAAPGQLGFDTDTALSSEQARALRQRGFRFCIRYRVGGVGIDRNVTADDALGGTVRWLEP